MAERVSDETIETTVAQLIVDEMELDVEPGLLDLNADLIEEYDADSLGLIQVLARINRTLGILVPRDEAVDLRTAGELVERVKFLRDGMNHV